MSYKFYMKKQNPISAWVLDDTIPFHDASGFGAFGDKLSSSSAPGTASPLVAGAANAKVFSSSRIGQFACNVFKPGLESRPFVLEAWVYPIRKTTTGPQQILSHDSGFDGLSIDGTTLKFSTIYSTTGEAAATYELGMYRSAYVVGMHFETENQLWVNNVLVASTPITVEQQGDTYLITDSDFLFTGDTASDQTLAVNGIAIYSSLTGDQIAQNYFAGINGTPKVTVAEQFGGIDLGIHSANTNKFLEYTWSDRSEFKEGLATNVQYSDEQIVPGYSGGLSLAGDWTVSLPLDADGDTSVYGVYVEWEGSGITVEHSVDGTTWFACVNRTLVSEVPDSFDPTGVDLELRVNFAGGVADDTAYLESLRVVGFKDNVIRNITERAVVLTEPAVARNDSEFLEYREDNGVFLDGGVLTIGTDPSADVDDVFRTLELWVNPRSGSPTINLSGTTYVNGVAGSTYTVGEWNLIHIVYASDVVANLTVSGNAVVARAVIYPDPLTADDVAFIFDAYTGKPTIQIIDSASVEVAEETTPVQIYEHDWSIDAAG